MSELLFAFVVNAIWQTTLIAGLAVPIARRRFTLLALTLIACVAAPMLTLAPRGGAVPASVVIAVPRHSMPLVVDVYLIGLAIVAMRFVIALLKARSIVTSSRPFRGPIRVSNRIAAPVTIGRTIVIPPHLGANNLAAAIAHEHAHVRRGDYFVHVALELIALPLWFHPMLILLRRAIADAREMACDERAASRRGRRAYAEALVRLASVAARTRPAMAVGIASTSIERRVASLLRPERRPSRALLIVPFLAAVACTRFNAAPAMIQGTWSMDLRASRIEGKHQAYEAFSQTIEQHDGQLSVRQKRVGHGRTELVNWSVITDGVTRPVGGVRGAKGNATWRDGKLQLQMSGPGRHWEQATAFIQNGRLICDGKSESSRYHTEFRRVSQ